MDVVWDCDEEESKDGNDDDDDDDEDVEEDERESDDVTDEQSEAWPASLICSEMSNSPTKPLNCSSSFSEKSISFSVMSRGVKDRLGVLSDRT